MHTVDPFISSLWLLQFLYTDVAVPDRGLGLVHLHFQRFEHLRGVARSQEYAAVGFLRHLEFEIQDEIRVGFLRPDGEVILGNENSLFLFPTALCQLRIREVIGKKQVSSAGLGMSFRRAGGCPGQANGRENQERLDRDTAEGFIREMEGVNECVGRACKEVVHKKHDC